MNLSEACSGHWRRLQVIVVLGHSLHQYYDSRVDVWMQQIWGQGEDPPVQQSHHEARSQALPK